MKLIAFLLLITCSYVQADANYILDRIVDARSGANAEISMYADGYALIEDDGPYTEIRRITVEVDACNGLQFSPAPSCDPYYLYIDALTNGYWGRGEFYYLYDNDHPTLTFLRRGSIETGDAALLLFVDQVVLIFAQALPEQL